MGYVLRFPQTNMAAVTWTIVVFLFGEKINFHSSFVATVKGYWNPSADNRCPGSQILNCFQAVWTIFGWTLAICSGILRKCELATSTSSTFNSESTEKTGRFGQRGKVRWIARLCSLKTGSRTFKMDEEDDLQPDSPPGFVEEIDSTELEITEVTM